MAPIDDAITKLEQGDFSAARNFLDRLIANSLRAIERNKDDKFRQQSQEHLEKLERVRRLLG